MSGEPFTYPLTIYFDGSCRLCESELENLAARDLHGQLRLIDCSRADFDARALPVTQAEMMKLIHARDANGQWLRGVQVFIAAYRAADLGWVARLLGHRLIRPHAERAYPWLVRNRYRVSAWGLHRLFNFLTHRALNRRAQQALARSRSCQAGPACKPDRE